MSGALVAALILVTSPQGPMQIHAEVPKWLCGRSGEGLLTPVGMPKIPMRISVKCGKK